MSNLSTKLRQKLITMLEDFGKFCEHHQLLATNSTILLTVSGGIDSVVLVDLFQKAGFKYAIAHCNFQLRGEEANGDEEFVKNIAAKNGVNFYSKRFNTAAFANEKGISTQMAARELRYEWFREICAANQIGYFATAHHLNDSLETVLLNLSKGTGIFGLKGISIKTEESIRPLLFADRALIEKYAADNHITWREDISNQSTKYQRNLLRHKVVPVLTEINQNLTHTFADTQERLQDTADFVQHWLNEYKRNHLLTQQNQTLLAITELKKVKGYKALLFELLKAFGFNYHQTRLIAEAGENGKVFYSTTHAISYYDDTLIITQTAASGFAPIQINAADAHINAGTVSLQLEYIKNGALPETFSADTAFIHEASLTFPLTLRTWQQGDSFCPIGMHGKKKLVSDLLNDLKIPVNQKNGILVLCSSGKIVWVAGLRIDERFKAIAGEDILKITIG